MKIENRKWEQLTELDLFVFTIGHEPRSFYLYDIVKDSRNKNNTIVFCFDERGIRLDRITQLKKKGIEITNCSYTDNDSVQRKIVNLYKEHLVSHDHVQLHIDYSSMPRSWYCSIPSYLSTTMDKNSELYLWYTAGLYPRSYKSYPSAAIESISVFSGVTLPSIDIKRYHIMGLGLDNIRTETVNTIVEPDLLICCYAYTSNNIAIKEQVQEVNKRILQSASLTVSLPMDNFEGMVDKLCGLAYDLLSKDAQVIFIPDGPKPLIMAMSIIPDLIKEPGITCLHISSNTSHYPQILIRPRENEVLGFHVFR